MGLRGEQNGLLGYFLAVWFGVHACISLSLLLHLELKKHGTSFPEIIPREWAHPALSRCAGNVLTLSFLLPKVWPWWCQEYFVNITGKKRCPCNDYLWKSVCFLIWVIQLNQKKKKICAKQWLPHFSSLLGVGHDVSLHWHRFQVIAELSEAYRLHICLRAVKG